MWPNKDNWGAEAQQISVESEAESRYLWTLDCGELAVLSGKLVASDPFGLMHRGNNRHIRISPGRYPVSVTLADVSPKQDRSDIRPAYMTLRLAAGKGVRRELLPLLLEGEQAPSLAEGEFLGFGVDAGTACFVDDQATHDCMPEDEGSWFDLLFDQDIEGSWFELLDQPEPIHAGIANIPLPLARRGESLLAVYSGWGDGYYPVIGLLDETDRLLAVHVDFAVIV